MATSDMYCCALTSTSLNKLCQCYKTYVKNQIEYVSPILPIEDYYFKYLKDGEISRSLIYERYLKDLCRKETETKIKKNNNPLI